MAIAQMAKVMIVSHRSEVADLLEALQSEGICQILDAEEALVTRQLDQTPDRRLRPKDLETRLDRIEKSIVFLKQYAAAHKGLAAALAPRTIVDQSSYTSVVSDDSTMDIVGQAEQIEADIDSTTTRIESLHLALESLTPWETLKTRVEELSLLAKATCWTGLIPVQQLDKAADRLTEIGAALQIVDSSGTKHAALVVGLNENAEDIAKTLRAAEFETVSFEGLTGTVRELLAERSKRLTEAQQQLADHKAKAAALSANLLKLQILCDYYRNLLSRQQAQNAAPTTVHTFILEGWVRKNDYHRLQKVVARFPASSINRMEISEDDQIPVEIENKRIIKPFEVITRLYGMPQHFEVDPTVFLAPFFALFFALCLTDAGYGLVLVALAFLFVKKMQGDKKLMLMLGICGGVTVLAGALTGGWFGNAHEYLPAWFGTFRNAVLWFDPFEKPMTFFVLALTLGYIQIMTGLLIALIHNLKRKEFVAALCDQLTWLVMLNSIVLPLVLGSLTPLPAWIGKISTITALLPAAAILLFSHREGAWVGRIGMGAYNLFSTIFFVGDVLSYLRLMALGMVTAGLAMAINVIAQIAAQIPYGIGVVAMIIVLVGGHGFNMAINALGAFVHTLRLQYVEFFPKFLIGGGRQFQPLTKEYKHVYIKKEI